MTLKDQIDSARHVRIEDAGTVALAHVGVPTNAIEVARLQRDAEQELVPLCRELKVASPDDYEAADAVLTDVVRQKDAALAMRKSATSPLYGVIKTVEGWFRPYVQALESCESSLKREMGAWRVELARLEAEKREAARVAAESGDAAALIDALTTVSAATAPTQARATTALRWVVKRLVPAIMTHGTLAEFMREHPVEAARWFANKHKAAVSGEEQPTEAGVIWEREARIGAKR